MVQIFQGKDITLAQLIDEFGLQLADDEHFFSEWQHDLPELSDLEKQSLNEVKAEYLHLSKYAILSPVVKMVMLSPLLRLAGFYFVIRNLVGCNLQIFLTRQNISLSESERDRLEL
jgi:hypothetical protein